MTTLPSVLVTGASSGIGATYADRFARRGHNLVLVARDKVRLDTLAADLSDRHGISVETIRADLTLPGEMAVVEKRLREDAQIGVLVNNAGAALNGAFIDQTPDDVERLVMLNATAVTRLANAAAPRMAQAGNGAIINIGSVVGLAPEFGSTVYGATKAFVLFFSQSLNLELASKGVYVQAVLPAGTRTEIWERSGFDANSVPPLMGVGELVDAALVGFDRHEAVTIPVLPDASQWDAFQGARQAIMPSFLQANVADRYRTAS